MSTELQSAQFTPADLNAPVHPPEEAVLATAVDSPSSVKHAARSQRTKHSNAVLAIIAVTLGVFGADGVIRGGRDMATYADNWSAEELAKTCAGETAINKEIANRAYVKQQQFKTVVYFNVALRILVGASFIVSCVLLVTRRLNASSVASLACVAAIFFALSTIVTVWLTTPSFTGIPGYPDGAGKIAEGLMIGRAVIHAIVKFGIYGFFIYYLSKPSIKSLFDQSSEAPTLA